MKNHFHTIVCLFLILFPTFGISAQNTTDSKPNLSYEYISPRTLREFMMALKDAGKRGFKYEKMTTLPGLITSTDGKKTDEKGLTGIVRYDGAAAEYDYNFFFAEGEDNPEATLNNLSKDGWYFRDVFSIIGGEIKNSLPIGDGFANRIRKIPAVGNLYLLERRADEKTQREYKLLKAGIGTGRTPTAKLQFALEEALKKGFTPIATYFTLDLRNIFSIDSAGAILLEKRETGEKREFKFVRGTQSDGLWKDIDEAAKQGFRLAFLSYNTAILCREPNSSAPVLYIHLEVENKNFQTYLTATLAGNPSFFSIASYGDGFVMDLNKNLLIFEKSSPSTEYKFVKIVPQIPKQYRKNPEEYAKTLENPEITFQKSLDEGYIPRDLYFSGKEGLVIVLTRVKK